MRTLIVGDVHGCLDELEELLARAGWTKDDELILAGDLVAKGPKSRGVVARARALGDKAVLGNHDARVLEAQRGEKTKQHHVDVARELAPEDLAYLEALPLYLELPRHHAIVVHAGLIPGVPLEEQPRDMLLNMRSFDGEGHATAKLIDGQPWAARWPGPALVVFGHDALRRLQRYPHAIGLDTGCVYGGELTAVWLPSREIVSVKAHRAWSETAKT